VPVAVLGAASVAWFVPTSRDPEAAPTDRRGVVLSTAAIGLLIFTLIEAPNFGWGSARTLASFAIVAVLFGAFVIWENRTETPMLDVELFRNPRFTAASASVTIAFFTLFGFIFLTTQFFQFFRHYSPLSTGVHLLPVAISVAVGSVFGTKLAIRFGTKIIVASGLAAISVFYLWVSSASPSTAYSTIVVEMVIYGAGLGFTSAPATEAILGVVPKAKAGVGSAVNDATRLLGGTLGVAILGSVFASLYASRLTESLPARLPPELVASSRASVGGALEGAGALAREGHPALTGTVLSAARAAFFHGYSAACLVAAGVAVAGACMAVALLPAQPSAPAESIPTEGAPDVLDSN
jgi:predicted MFS family arabinose efflux permease